MSNEETWVKLEIMGHRVLVGKVMPSALIPGFIRIDVVDAAGDVTSSQEYGAGSIYGLTYISREVALELAKRFAAPPVTEWDVRGLVDAKVKLLTAPTESYPEFIDRDGIGESDIEDDNDRDF